MAACASALGDSYCSMAWGAKLADRADAPLRPGSCAATTAPSTRRSRPWRRWARQVSRDPNATSVADVESLRDAGFDDRRIFAITAYVACRLAFSTVNDALGARPDPELAAGLPAEVRDAVTFGRPVAEPR